MKILQEAQGLAYIKGKWVEIDQDKLKQALAAFEQVQHFASDGELSIKDAMRLQLSTDNIGNIAVDQDMLQISNGQWLESVFDKLHNPHNIKSVKPGSNFKAILRPYQQQGLNWLYFLHSLQFGACLADDMGLGKTIQVLAFINYLKKHKSKTANLLILPLSLISNWQNEIAKFAPKIKYFTAHPSYEPKIRKMSIDKDFFK